MGSRLSPARPSKPPSPPKPAVGVGDKGRELAVGLVEGPLDPGANVGENSEAAVAAAATLEDKRRCES